MYMTHPFFKCLILGQKKCILYTTQYSKEDVQRKILVFSLCESDNALLSFMAVQVWFLGDLRWVALFGLKWAKSVRAKSKHLQEVSSKSMCITDSWSRWGLIWDLLGSFGSFWVGDNVQGRNLSNLNFWVSEVKKVIFGSAEKMGCECRNVSISHKAQIFGERSMLMKCSILYGGLRGNIWFLSFEHLYMVFK